MLYFRYGADWAALIIETASLNWINACPIMLAVRWAMLSGIYIASGF
jgi:hypothetical protein